MIITNQATRYDKNEYLRQIKDDRYVIYLTYERNTQKCKKKISF